MNYRIVKATGKRKSHSRLFLTIEEAKRALSKRFWKHIEDPRYKCEDTCIAKAREWAASPRMEFSYDNTTVKIEQV